MAGSSLYAPNTIPKVFRYPPNAIFDRGSNYGKDCVDILAPGEKIPILDSQKVTLANGTSDATAIVTGAAVLLASCKPWATANEIRETILHHADKHPKALGNQVDQGRVLNIYRAASNFCDLPKKIIPKKPQTDEQSYKKEL